MKIVLMQNVERYNDRPEHYWNQFYNKNNVNFFKNRKWLQQEFPILAEVTQADSPPTTILEVGAGAGNTAFPILQQNQNPGLKLVACDFSRKAVELIQNNPLYKTEDLVGSIEASVWDVASLPDEETGNARLPAGIAPGSADVVILVFVFSALEPRQWEQAVRNVWTALKPGGVVLFRDYGRGDLAQVRFKKQRYLEENFYVRGDGTRVYFFDEGELRKLWIGEMAVEDGDTKGESKASVQSNHTDGEDGVSVDAVRQDYSRLGFDHSKGHASLQNFEMVGFGVDRRMLVNRQRRLKMYRCWMQGLFRKPFDGVSMMAASEAASRSAVEVPAVQAPRACPHVDNERRSSA